MFPAEESSEVEISAEVNLLRVTYGLIVAARRIGRCFGGEVRTKVDPRILQRGALAAPVTGHSVLVKQRPAASCLLGHCGTGGERGSGEQDQRASVGTIVSGTKSIIP